MTTTVGIVCDEGVVLATDNRATMGSFIASKKARKVYDISEKIGMTTAGAVGDLQSLVRFMKSHIDRYNTERKKPMTASDIPATIKKPIALETDSGSEKLPLRNSETKE